VYCNLAPQKVTGFCKDTPGRMEAPDTMTTTTTNAADDDRDRVRLLPWLHGQDADARREELMLALDAVAEAGGVQAAWEAVMRWAGDHRGVLVQHLARHAGHYFDTRELYLDARRERSPQRRGKPRKRQRRR